MCYNWLLVYHMHGRCRGFCFVMFSCFLLCHYNLLLYNSSCAATLKVGPSKLRPYSRGTRKATLSGGALIPCCLLKSSSPCKISSWSIVESHPSSLTFFHLQKAQTKLTGVDDFQRFLSCMVTRHWYSMYCTSSTVTIGNTEKPLPSLLVSSWRRVGHPKMPSLFGENVTLRPSCTIQTRNEDNVSWPSGRKTAGSHSSPSIALKTPPQTYSSIHKRPQMWNFGPATKAGHFVTNVGNWNLESSCRHSAEGLQPHWTRRANAATPPMSSPTWMMSLSCCGTSPLKTRDCWARLTSTVGIMWECLTDIARGQAHSAYPSPKNWFNKRSCMWTIPQYELSSSRFMTSWSWRKTAATRASSWCISAASAHHPCMKSFLRHFTAV